jgi:hypothetical protein
VRAFLLMSAAVLAISGSARAQEPCRVLCSPEFHVEPTVTFTNLFRPPRVATDEGTAREQRDAEFELILSFGLPTRFSWLEFTVEAIFLPFESDSTPELEFETNFIWLPGARTGGWVGSHVDVVDKLSAAGRPSDRRAYTHKLNFEFDTTVAIFNWLPRGRWLQGVEVETSLDYVATGLPRRGDAFDGVRFLDDASPWSLSFVLVVPVAPM